MKPSTFLSVGLLLGLALASGCAANQATATRVSDMDLRAVKTIYLVKHAEDTRGVVDIVKTNLTGRGYQVTVGPDSQPPFAADAVVKYVDKWMWDISMYMIELTISFRNPATDFPTLSGHSLHTSLTRKSPEAMVQEVLDNIFKVK